ncbi:MAG: hypothetical protein ACOCWM_04200 [Cyclobacteriaceae bacterium]
MKKIIITTLCWILYITYTFSQSQIGITGGMNLSVLSGTVNTETSFKPDIIRQKSDTCWRCSGYTTGQYSEFTAGLNLWK